MEFLSSILLNSLPSKRKSTPSGWISFNAPCCHHNGHGIDNRGRGGLKINDSEGISYHCFNCGFKCSWTSGRSLSKNFKNFLQWLNIPDETINQISLSLLRYTELDKKSVYVSLPKFKQEILPEHFVEINSITNPTNDLLPFLIYIKNRNLYLDDTKFYYSADSKYRNRLFIPFYYNNDLVGWTGRTITNNKVKYLTNSQPGYVYGLDQQTQDRKIMIICEGPFDALQIDGVSVLGSQISEAQIKLLLEQKKEIIVVPDRDKAGKKLVDQALDLNWSVSLPKWSSNINDIGDAVDKYGRLLTIYSIVQAKESSQLKIKLGVKQWFG